MFDHQPLLIWQRSHALSLDVDRALARRKRRAAPGLVSQLSRACAAIPANIAECAGQDTALQSVRFLDIAIGSSSETENHLARAGGLGLITEKSAAGFIADLRETRRMMIGFRKWLLRNS